jgi:galactokinase
VSADATRLRDLSEGALPALEGVASAKLFRRARHVVTENARVDACRAALEAGELPRAGELLRGSHASLRDDYEVSVPELDFLCATADAHPRVYGSRLTGAGFGGCTLHLVEHGSADDIVATIGDAFEERFFRKPRIFEMESGEGVSALDVA